MELVEKLPLKKIQFLSTFTFNDFKPFSSSHIKNDEERKIQYNILIHYCETNIKTRCQTTRIYSFTLNTPNEVGGRLYSGNSIQGMSSIIRGFLLSGITTDIDMKNAHPVILEYLCNLHKIKCPNLSHYNKNRDELLIEYGKEFKTEFLKSVNYDKPNRKMKDKFCKDFDKECKVIQERLCLLECYKPIINTIPDTRKFNCYGSGINRILCVYENKILQEMISVINKKNIEIYALMFDGLIDRKSVV